MSLAYEQAPRAPFRLTLSSVQNLCVWLMMAMGWLVIIEPAPTDLLFVLALSLFLFTGLKIHAAVAPLIVFLLLYNLGGFISFLEVSQESDAIFFVIASIYMACMAIFMAFYIPGDPMGRMAIVKNGWIIAGVIASINGMIGYFNVFGMAAEWAPILRAQGTFKDPNVLSTFLLAPAILLIHGFMLGTQKWRILSAGALLIILAGLFLAFSRGAWISFMASATLCVAITFAVTPSMALRTRIIIFVALGLIAAVAGLAFLMSIEQVRELFLQRASLVQSYDAGERGRFGDQLRSIPILLDRPLGFGPTYFRRLFGNDPHNVYLNAFASYGWLGGLSYPLLCISTAVAGWKSMMKRTPWQPYAIAVFCPLFTTMLQGVQIDTDHWRHFYLLLGLTWGFYAASVNYRGPTAAHRSDLGQETKRPSGTGQTERICASDIP